MQDSTDFFTVKDIAKRLKVSEDYVRKQIRDKKLRAFTLGNDYRISESDLQDFLRRRATIDDTQD